MSSERNPYSRIYWTVMDDTKFDGIRSDMRHFGSWTLMLVIADMAYPAPAFIPPTVSRRSVSALQEARLIEVMPDGRYRVKGLVREREQRSDHARAAAETRWRNAPAMHEHPSGNAQTMPSKGIAEQSIEEAEAQAPRAPDPADVYWTLTGRYPSITVLGWVDQLTEEFGPEPVIRALATVHHQDSTTSTLLGRTTDLLRADARKLSVKAQEAVRDRLKERRAAPRAVVDPAAVQAEVEKILRGEAA